MPRSANKGPFVDDKLIEKVNKIISNKSPKTIKTWARRSTITPEMVGFTMQIHNGNKFINVFITEPMVGHKLGEFAPTRTFRAHSSKKGLAEGAK